MENILVKRFKEDHAMNVSVNGTILNEITLEIANRLIDLKNFTASNGWIDWMKKRHNLVYRLLSGGSSSVDEATIEEWRKNLPNLIKVYKPKDIFNADKTRLFFNILPEKNYVIKQSPAIDGRCLNCILQFNYAVILMGVKR